MNDLKELDILMERAKGVANTKKQDDEREAKAIIDSYLPQLTDLRRAEAEIVEHSPEAKRIQGYVEGFPWHLVRERGQPAEISESLFQLRRCMSAVNHIRKVIKEIESAPKDVHTRWRLEQRDVAALVGTADYMLQTMGGIKRSLERWGTRLEEKLPPIAGGNDAIEGNAPPDAGPEIKVISNFHHE